MPACKGSSPGARSRPGRRKDRRRADRASTAPEPEAQVPACRDACRCGPSNPLPHPARSGHRRQTPDPDAPGRRHRRRAAVRAASSTIRPCPQPAGPSATRRLQQGRRRRRVDLNRKQDRAVSPGRLRRARQPSPGEDQALRHAVRRSPRWPPPPAQRLFDDPRLLVLAPAPAALDPQNLPIHLCVTLRLALRSHPSRPRRPQTRRPPPDGCRREARTSARCEVTSKDRGRFADSGAACRGLPAKTIHGGRIGDRNRNRQELIVVVRTVSPSIPINTININQLKTWHYNIAIMAQ